MMRLTRRQLLLAGAAGAAAFAAQRLTPGAAYRRTQAAQDAPRYASFADLYREAWSWDRVVRGTHLRANCFSACSFDVYVKGGVVLREEQADVYAREAPGRSDFAPRGCQKGCSYADLMVAPGRLLHPLERAGPRGSGRWRRVSWDDALTRLADGVLEAVQEGGPETVVFDNGTSNVDDGPSSLGEMRLFTLLGATLLDGFGGTGDLAMGAVQTWGTSFVDGSADDWMRADTLVFWHCNPAATRIPDFHFATEARYRGSELVVVAPDYSPTTVHASLWVNPRVGSDAALALGVARALLEQGAVDEDYVREQTDLPLLVREDTGRFLRRGDLEEGGGEDVFYVHDLAAGGLAEAPGGRGTGGSLALGKLVPALAGRFEVSTAAGVVAVRPLLERLRERLAEYEPARVAALTGVAPGVQARLAARIAASPRTLIYASWGSNKSHHADLLQRALILIAALRGQQGRPGGGVRFAAWLPLSAEADLVPGGGPSALQRLLLKVYTPAPRALEDAIAAASEGALRWTPSHAFLHVHGGLAELQDPASDRADPTLPRPASRYLDDAFARGWLPVRPAPERPPRVLFVSGSNPLRRWPAPQRVEQVLWPKLHTIAVVDFRLSTTALKADLVLPAAGYYEKRGIKYAIALVPYAVIGDRAVAPLGESLGEWEIAARLARRIQARARERGLAGPAARLWDRFSEGGRLDEQSEEALLDRILSRSAVAGRIGWREAARRGAVPLASAGGWSATSAVGSELEPGGTLSPSRVFVEEKRAWPTLTGRQQFLLEHAWFVEADEALPRWKPLPGDASAFPIRLTGGHARWSIHAIWRAHPELLRLQRGGPALWMAAEDARARGVRDGDRVRVWNEWGEFRLAARVAPSVAPGEAILDHAWEPYQFEGWRGNMEVVANPYKPLHVAGGYGQLRYRVFQAGPIHAPRGVAVEIARDAGEPA
jgi:DMSO reductase family type II enzyme molybdopterin subunit